MEQDCHYKKEALNYYMNNLKNYNKDDHKYKENIRRIEWILRTDKLKPLTDKDELVIVYCNDFINKN